jgi:RNA polymerase sigma factor (sigma-70 family)
MLLLIQGCIRNDRESQRLLYQHYYGYAFSICVRYCRTDEEAKEVVNDGFLKCFGKISQYNMNTSFRGWLRRIMVNASIDHYRKELRHYQSLSIDLAVSKGAYQVNETITDALGYMELIDMIRELSPSYRAVFNLHVIEGYSHKEIADMLGISSGTSKSNLLKARERLRTMLSKRNEIRYAKSI